MTITFKPGAGQIFRPATDADFVYRLTPVVGYNDFSGSSISVVVKDANITRITSDYSDPYYDIQIQGDATDVTLSVLDATGVLDSNNRLSRVSDGNCRVQGDSWLKRSIINCDMTRINEHTYTTLDGYAAGSLARHIVDQTTALIGSHTADDMPIYSVQNHTGATYTRNTSCWVYPLNLTAISPWNSRGGQTRGGVAITPRHVLVAKHYPLAVSDTVRFVTAGNVVVDRTVDAIYNVPETVAYSKDVQIVRLDSDLPASITPVKFLPANAYEYLPSWDAWPLPLIYTNQSERMACAPSKISHQSAADYVASIVTTEPPYGVMYEQVIVGDSGSPTFVVINGTPVLICHWTFAGMGAAHHMMLTEIAATLTTLGGGHTLSTVDLSSFTDYS